ncbi:uncharacterized protein LOC113208849 [Frankliniella occidentalis]|uniref:Uncharacterized protein LOC113208849 n=1 Tax=Frankliniella occidentalis TaxID=133901 RepID=A0A6J1SKP5_FRAOC|nr:uncharacterized protein LOC113208849 [Frankliniella occidentalis]
MNPKTQCAVLVTVIAISSLMHTVECIRCYQCSSGQDPKGEDNCGAYDKFDKNKHIAVECTSDESSTPGSFCMKVTQQGPKGFIWDGRWRQVIRRCASVSETGVTGVCNWGVYENGVYWEECYCSEDSCNGSHESQSVSKMLIISAACGIISLHFLRVFW